MVPKNVHSLYLTVTFLHAWHLLATIATTPALHCHYHLHRQPKRPVIGRVRSNVKNGPFSVLHINPCIAVPELHLGLPELWAPSHAARNVGTNSRVHFLWTEDHDSNLVSNLKCIKYYYICTHIHILPRVMMPRQASYCPKSRITCQEATKSTVYYHHGVVHNPRPKQPLTAPNST